MQINELMNTDIAVIAPHSTLMQAACVMRDHQVGALPVLDEKGRITGIVTDRDIVLRAVSAGEDAEKATVSQVMSAPAITVNPQEDAEDAAGLMARYGIRRLPVVEDGALVGMVSVGDFASELGQKEQTTRLMYHLSLQQPGGGPKNRM